MSAIERPEAWSKSDGGPPRGPRSEAGRIAELEAEVAALKARLEDKSELLREVNHRAKNSLQMAMAMLSIQALAAGDERVSAALEGASTRLGYLARVHELLYQRSDDVQSIDIAGFLTDVVTQIESAFSRPEVAVIVEAEAASLKAEQAMNVVLIAGEAVLNAYKYAFPDGRGGTVRVRFRTEGEAGELRIEDDGTGFAVEPRRGSLGMRLLRAMGRALGGETQVSGEAGTRVAVRFPLAA
jgi:two-component sensor histidine kinase